MRIMSDLTKSISSKIKDLTLNRSSLPVILCIGSDRVTGDCLGPLVGQLLTSEHNICAYVYGSLSSPVNALNLIDTVAFIKNKHPDSLIIAVDSSLGERRDIGTIRVLSDGIYPGAAAGKSLPKVGNVAITATVAELKKSDLYGVRLGLVYFLAKNIASALSLSLGSA